MNAEAAHGKQITSGGMWRLARREQAIFVKAIDRDLNLHAKPSMPKPVPHCK
jgi:hypothetical protein